MRIKLTLLFLLINLFTIKANDSYQISIKGLDVNTQLPSNTVYRVYQDRIGYIWLATEDGFCRFDGNELLTFRSNTTQPDLLKSNDIKAIAEDYHNQLWIGTVDGLYIMSLTDFSIKEYPDPTLQDELINWITVSSDQSIWVATNKTLYKLNSDLQSPKRYDHYFSNTDVINVYEDLDQNIWIGTKNKGMHRYDKQKDSFVGYPPIGKQNSPYRFLQDKDNNYWVCTWGDGLFRFEPDKPYGSNYTPYSLNGTSEQEKHTFSIIQDPYYNYLWVMSHAGVKVFKYDENTQVAEIIDTDYLFENTNNIFSEFTLDNNGNIWIGAYNEGAYLIDFSKQDITHLALDKIKEKTQITPNINTLYQDKDDHIWFSQGRIGLGVYNLKTKDLKFYQQFPTLADIGSFENINCIEGFQSRPNEIWVGPRDKDVIYRISTENNTAELIDIISLRITDNPFYYPKGIFEDSFNNIWIHTNAHTLLFIKKGTTEVIETKYEFGYVTDIDQDADNCLWISTKNHGIFRVPITQEGMLEQEIELYSKGNADFSKNITTLSCSIDQVWIGTAEGAVYAIDKKTKEITNYSDQFASINEGIQDIVVDDYDNIWISTNKRIVLFYPPYEIFKEFNQVDVIIDSFRKGAVYLTEDGQLLYGGNLGITAFQTQKSKPQTQHQETFVSNVKIQGKSLLENNSDKFNPVERTLTLDPNDRYIELDFSALNFNDSYNVAYKYKLEGVDKDWINTSAERPYALYNELQKGNYTFLLSSTDENHIWSSKITKFTIIRKPAFYESNWAYLVYTLLFFVLVYYAIYIIRRRIRIKNKLRFAELERENIEKLAQTKLQYFTNISHEFLTPLTIISCIIDDMEMTSKKNLPLLNIMRSNTNRLRRLLQQILDFRKIESEKMELKVSSGDLVKFMHEVCYTNFLPLIKKKEINFIFSSVAEELPAYFDYDKLDKVVYNILSNTFKYTDNKGVIQVTLNSFYKDNLQYAEIKISDTGIGIAAEEQKNIFNTFYNNRHKLTTNTNGLGLSLAKSLLELFKGTISLESQEGEGSCFTISFPIEKAAFDKADLSSESEVVEIITKDFELDQPLAIEHQEDEQGSTQIISPKLLLVEDNAELLELMERILSRKYQIITAIDGVAALEAISKNEVDLIISDVMMPRMDGWELCRQVKDNIETCDIPIILLTAKVGIENQIACYEAGANGYISKPFDLQLLEARIDNFLEAKQNRQKDFKQSIQLNIETLETVSMDEELLKNAVDYIEKHISEVSLSVDSLAETLNLSRSSLYRKIKNITGLSPVEFIRNIRLKHASAMLGNESLTIADIAYAVGFTDPKYFSKCFKTEFGMTPSEFSKNLSE